MLPPLAQYHALAEDCVGPLPTRWSLATGEKWNLHMEGFGMHIGTASVSSRLLFLCAGREGGSARNAYKIIGEAN